MINRKYYSIRTGKNPSAEKYDLQTLLKLFKSVYAQFEQKNYFQEALGYICVDAGEIQGFLGRDIEAIIIRKIRKPNLWPVLTSCMEYTEDDLFDVIEFLFDNISYPVEGYYHDYSDCGWHYKIFDKVKGQEEFRTEVNELLRDYQEGYELSEEGEILALADNGLEPLLSAPILPIDPQNVDMRIEAAKKKFRRHRSSFEDRRDAIRDLADVFEFLRPKLADVLDNKDENDLFNIANNFAIRHHNEKQKQNYDKGIWYSWMFYFYLATIHAVTRLIEKKKENNNS